MFGILRRKRKKKNRRTSASIEVSEMARISFPGESGFTYPDEEEKALIEEIEANADTLKPLPEAEKDAVREVVKALQTA